MLEINKHLLDMCSGHLIKAIFPECRNPNICHMTAQVSQVLTFDNVAILLCHNPQGFEGVHFRLGFQVCTEGMLFLSRPPHWLGAYLPRRPDFLNRRLL